MGNLFLGIPAAGRRGGRAFRLYGYRRAGFAGSIRNLTFQRLSATAAGIPIKLHIAEITLTELAGEN
jgi:hypothetical protein